MSSHIVAKVDEIAPGERKIVDVAGRSIGVFNVNGEFFALRNRCPHQGGPLCRGQQLGSLVSTRPGEYVYDRQGELIRCPWHGWEFDLRTGASWFDPQRTKVRTYDVSIRDDLPAEAPAQGLVRGPYVAETYPVRTDDQYVVVELEA